MRRLRIYGRQEIHGPNRQMKKRNRILIFIVALLIAALAIIFNQVAPILSGFGAKDLCSCVFVGGRNETSVLENELGGLPFSLGTFKVSFEDSSATGSVFGLARVKAIYRKGLGCTLVREKSAGEIKKDLPSLNIIRPVLSDTLPWPYGTKVLDKPPENVNAVKLKAAVDKAFTEDTPDVKKNTRAVVVIYKNKLIIERYAPGFDRNSPQLGWSMSKSITNAMIGMLVQEGKLDIYAPAPVSVWKDPQDPRHRITIDQLLRMSSGLEWEEVYSKKSSVTIMLYEKANMGLYAASQKLQYQPDEKWYYSSGTTNILQMMMRDMLGDSGYYSFLYDKLFYKLGVRTAVFEPDASGTLVGSSYMWASARDWARLGLLFLNDGVWNGERILPEGWTKYSSTPTPGAPQGKYGAQFWLNAGSAGHPDDRVMPDVPADAFYMDGYEGQTVLIVPSKHAVIVRLGQNKKGAFDFNHFLASVLNAIE